MGWVKGAPFTGGKTEALSHSWWAQPRSVIVVSTTLSCLEERESKAVSPLLKQHYSLSHSLVPCTGVASHAHSVLKEAFEQIEHINKQS